MSLKYDWETLTAQWVGDIIAHRLGRGIRSLRVRLQYSATRLKQTSMEYWQEEAQQFPVRSEIAEFSAAVNELSSKTEPLMTSEANDNNLQKTRA